MKVSDQVKWISRDVKAAIVDLDFSMIDYQEDAWPFCQRHPSDVSSEADLNDLGREVRTYLIANPEPETDGE